MKYILNKTPLRTNEGYKLNDLKIDLDIPKITEFSNFSTNYDKINYFYSNSFSSDIGLNFDKNYKLDINITRSRKEPIILEYNFSKEKILVNEISITLNENIACDFIIKYKSDYEIFNNVKINIKLNKNSKLNLSVVNLINEESSNFLEISSDVYDNSSLLINYVDLGGKLRVSNIKSNLLGKKANYNLNSFYLGLNNDRIDINYYLACKEKNTNGVINLEGALSDHSLKSFKGTIDFMDGSSKSNGEENENCILLSDTCKSLSLPMLLCHEEDVSGAHGVSSGKIDDDKLFYLMSRGITEKDAKKLIITSNFNKIIKNIPIENIKKEINEFINRKI